MRLYPRLAPQQVIDHPKWGRFEAQPDGGFDLPDDMSDEMHRFHYRGKRIWENDEERSVRRHQDDLERRRDPASLYDAVDNFTGMLNRLSGAQAPATSPLDPEQEMAVLKARLAELEAAGDKPAGEADSAKAAAKAKSAAKA